MVQSAPLGQVMIYRDSDRQLRRAYDYNPSAPWMRHGNDRPQRDKTIDELHVYAARIVRPMGVYGLVIRKKVDVARKVR